jgi:hypothetical protein
VYWLRFPDAGWAADEHVTFLLDIEAGGQIENLLAIDGRIEGEVEAFQGFAGVDGGPAQAQRQLLVVAAFDFVLRQAGQELNIGPLLGDGLLIADLERFEDAGQAQALQARGELVLQVH